jgi:hypothetical protein
MACCVLAGIGIGTVMAIATRLFNGRSKDGSTGPLAWRLEIEDE